MNWQALDASILLPAFVAGLLVLSTHVPLGQMVLKRGIIFIDLAVAQVAVGVANVLLRVPVEVTGLHSALAAGLICCLGVSVREVWRENDPASAVSNLG